MIKPEKSLNEEERLNLLESYAILDTLPEEEYDNLTMIASQICNTPIAFISFIDTERQWFKSLMGLNMTEVERDLSMCGHAINDPSNVMVVPDTRNDVRFFDNPAVTGEANVVFYAGVPLVNDKGIPLGTLCVIDNKPKTLTDVQIASLKALSQQTMKLLELRLNKLNLEKTLESLEKTNTELERFAYIAAHDLKSPLANISGLSDLLISDYSDAMNHEVNEILNLIKSSSDKLKEMIDSLLTFSKSNTIEKVKTSLLNISVLEHELKQLFAFNTDVSIVINSNGTALNINKTAFEQMLINLVSNAIKYNDKEKTNIKIEILDKEKFYTITVIDNGPGILKEHQESIFELFEVATATDKFGDRGTGIGLATVKKLVEALHGTIKVESEMGIGTKFIMTLAH
ncbi:sensor histidine kinase [Flavobacterium sp. XS1P32]|uniref:sensor histidine kinase n=1 Tax=Flavobacterium sp. XS1P32 TaxID=3401726 RepID=UPI003AB0C310